VLAYSGGLDTSVILRWLKDNFQAEIIAFCADIGQQEELDGLEEKALKTGASKCIIEDLREEFGRDFIFPMFQAGAIYEGQYLLGTSIARPLIAKRMVEIARAENAGAVAHGATGKGNDQVRFELAAAALAPDLRVIAPWREERFRKQFPGRAEMVAFAKANGIPVEASLLKPYAMDGEIETHTMDHNVMPLRDSLIPKYTALVYNGFWFSPERDAMQALVTETQHDVTGVARLKLYKLNIIVAGRKSPKSLYDPKNATM